jgi:enoyl-CoA hydratase/carnithine racemase/NADPH:quinone reductase-like Zn-dependent oxidoreductase
MRAGKGNERKIEAMIPTLEQQKIKQSADKWPLGRKPSISFPIPERMDALTIHRDCYGLPSEVIRLEEVAVPKLYLESATQVLVSILASGPNFNTNFAALGLPVPVFGRGDSATVHIPGSDALGIVVDAGPAVKSIRVGQAVILDAWTVSRSIRGYETHDGFNAQFVLAEEQRAIPLPAALSQHSPEQLAALLLTYGTAYRAVVERLAVRPGDSVLFMGGGKGTSFAGAQIAKTLGARVILFGSNPGLGQSLIDRGFADAFIDRRSFPANIFGVIPQDTNSEEWKRKTEPFRQAVYAANAGRPVDKVFEHTGGRNFPLLISALAEGGSLAFFGATGGGRKGEYKETFFYEGRRFVLDARWVWMRQKQVIFRNSTPRAIFSEIQLLPGRKGVIWGADSYAVSFAQAALERGANLVVIASRTREAQGIAGLIRLGIPESHIIDRDGLALTEDMPDPLTEDGRSNPAYGPEFMNAARALGRAVWDVFGPRVSPDFVVERPDQSTLHLSTFLLRDYDERDEQPSGWVILKGNSNLSILGSHMYRTGQAHEVIRLLAEGRIVMEQEDLEITTLQGLPGIQQAMLDGRMRKPKGVALVQASHANLPIAEYQQAYLGETLRLANEDAGHYLAINWCDGVAIVTMERPKALNALSKDLLVQIEGVIDEVASTGALDGHPVRAMLLRGSGRAFMAGADITGFVDASRESISAMAAKVIGVYDRLEQLKVPVVAIIDGFALGGGNELAMSTHYRIVTEHALIGQPEIKLGIMPGYGGMQRLPRLVGPRRALELVLNGEPVDGHRAIEIGLADAFCPAATALREAFRVAQEMAAGVRPIPRRNWETIAAAQKKELYQLATSTEITDLLSTGEPDSISAANLISARSYAARVAIEALQTGYEKGFDAGLQNDARLFGEVTNSPSGQYWVRRFMEKDPRQSALLTLLPPR